MSLMLILALVTAVLAVIMIPKAYPDDFIPEIWSKKLQMNYDNSSRAANLCNRDYEGEIKAAGDTIKIRKFGSVTIQDYTGAALTDETLTAPLTTVAVTQAKAFSIAVDDVDAAQADVAIMAGYTQRAGVAMALAVDTYVQSVMVAGAAAGNAYGSTGTPKAPAASTVYGMIVDIGAILDVANIPAENRWLLVTPTLKAVVQKSTEMTHSTDKADGIIINGLAPAFKIAGINIFVSTNIPLVDAGTDYYACPFGHPDFCSFANQFTEMRSEYVAGTFKQRVLGLNVFDAWAINPTAGGVFYTTI